MSDITTHVPKLGVFHLAIVGAALFVALYVLCWAGAAIGINTASHLYLALFTTANIPSLAALTQGVLLSLGFGALTGALGAVFFNLFRFVVPR